MTAESTLTRRFSRPRDYSHEAMKAELAARATMWGSAWGTANWTP